MKVFISHNMSKHTDAEIEVIRRNATEKIKDMFPDEEIEILENYIHDNPPETFKGDVSYWYLGESIKQLGEADFVYFVDGECESRGCQAEIAIARINEIPSNLA